MLSVINYYIISFPEKYSKISEIFKIYPCFKEIIKGNLEGI